MNEQTIRQWYDIFKDNKDLTEIRILDNNNKRTFSGYFTDIETLLNGIKQYDNCNIYFTLNTINDACYSREQHDRIVMKPKSTTSDNEIMVRKWILIDIDCKKPSDTNSTDEEKELAKDVVNNVYKFLRDQGFEKPIVCDSSNGFHLCYRCAMNNIPENTETIKFFLQVLDMLFSTEKIEIDTSTFNASRICKLYGCISRKGSNTKERPQRESKILKVPSEIKVTANEYYQKVAAMLPKQEVPNRTNNYSNESFDLDSFITKHGIKVRNITQTSAYTKYVLEECVFDSSHRSPDAALFKMANGAIGYKCLHNSCSQYTWRDVRLKFEPDAYDKKDYREYQQKQRYNRPINTEEFKPLEETSDKGKKWLSMSDIKYIDINSIVAIPTGYFEMDKKIMGLLLGDVTIISGLSGTGKTSWIDCLCLNVIQKGYKVAIWSGELQDFRFQGWINQIAAGKNYVKKKDGYDNIYYAPQAVCEKINEWDKDKLFLYNNEYGSKWSQLFCDIKEIVEKEKVNLIILDNLMSLNISIYDGDKYTQQTLFINELKEFAKKKNVHIILVCHPRKETGFLRKESISGTADLTNLCDNLFIIHRIGKDFQTRASEFLESTTVSQCMQFDSVIEICKNRSLGILDYFVGMYYERESRRLKNSISEHIIYGWEDNPIEQRLSDNISFPFEPNHGEETPF
ncbi:MAG: AAA family ATPase [Parabacteroides sp.]